jgi:phosphorylcholine metabolism protein LicD
MKNLLIAQKKMIKMLKIFHEICIKLNIKYWCIGGTMIGAVRHADFIPWDGDIDVGMTLKDYNILKTHIQEFLPSNLYFFGIGNNPGIGKLRDLYSTYTDYSKKINKNHHGLQLDIFVYNLLENNSNKQLISINKFIELENSFNFETIFPVKLAKFEDIEVFIPNDVEKVCNYYYKGYPPPFPKKEDQICHEGNIDALNPAPYYYIEFKELYTKKKKQWINEIINDTNRLNQMGGINNICEDEYNSLFSSFIQGINLEENSKIFDAGCGVGKLFEYIYKINNKIKLYGCDINENAVNNCKTIFPDSIVTVDEITKLNNYESNYFDNIICISTISYFNCLDDVKIAVNELLRIVKVNGKINFCNLTDNINELKLFNIIIQKNFWCKEIFKVSEINIIDLTFSKYSNRYSVFIKK